MTVRIVICDDHPLFREGLRRMLGTVSDFSVVGEIGRGDELVAECLRARPDVVVLDLELPGTSGIAAAEELFRVSPAARVLVLSAFGEPSRVRAALHAGALGYVLKNAPPAEVIQGIRKVAAGESVLSLSIAEAIADSLRREPEQEQMRRKLSRLTERELEVLRLAARGESNAGIGKRLFISEGTVKNHITHILRKLELEHRTQAAVVAVRYGLVD
jgi:DNA-binding NarL/FixJ family response regulator